MSLIRESEALVYVAASHPFHTPTCTQLKLQLSFRPQAHSYLRPITLAILEIEITIDISCTGHTKL
jgi:hypothetical protein